MKTSIKSILLSIVVLSTILCSSIYSSQAQEIIKNEPVQKGQWFYNS